MPDRKQYSANPQYFAKKRQEWRKANPEKYADLQKRTQANYRKRKKAEAFAILGNKCAHCGITDPRVLQIDHVNGGGYIDRKSSRGKTAAIYRRIIAGESGFQLLCANCNWIKLFENREHGYRNYVPVYCRLNANSPPVNPNP